MNPLITVTLIRPVLFKGATFENIFYMTRHYLGL